jgi:hypothetical protein
MTRRYFNTLTEAKADAAARKTGVWHCAQTERMRNRELAAKGTTDLPLPYITADYDNASGYQWVCNEGLTAPPPTRSQSTAPPATFR